MTNICVLSQIAHVANDQRLHACLVQRGDESARLLVLDRFDLMFDLLELFLLGTNEFLSATGTFLLPINLLVQMFLELIAILPLRSEVPSIKDVRLGSIMRDRHVDLA